MKKTMETSMEIVGATGIYSRYQNKGYNPKPQTQAHLFETPSRSCIIGAVSPPSLDTSDTTPIDWVLPRPPSNSLY